MQVQNTHKNSAVCVREFKCVCVLKEGPMSSSIRYESHGSEHKWIADLYIS